MLKKQKLKKHSLEDKLKAVELYEQGYGCTTISSKLSISETLIIRWLRIYRSKGVSGFAKRANTKASIEMKQEIVYEVLENNLSCESVSLKYPVSRSAVASWVSKVKQGGYAALMQMKKRGRPPKNMGRPKKKNPETELEKLKEELRELKAENAYLKKLRALVEERQARERGKKPKSSDH